MVVVVIFSCCLLSRFGIVNVFVDSLNIIRLFDSMFGISCGMMMWCSVVNGDVLSDSVVCLVCGLSCCSVVYMGIIMNGSIMCISVIMIVKVVYLSLYGLRFVSLSVWFMSLLVFSSMF